MFQQEDALHNIANTETKLDREPLTFFEKIEADEKPSLVGRNEQPEYRLFDRTIESNTSPTPREITIEFLDTRNGEKYDRLVRDVKLVAPFKRQSSANSPISSMDVIQDENDIGADASAGASTINQHDRQECTSVSHSLATTPIVHMESENSFGSDHVTEAATINEPNQVEATTMSSYTMAHILACNRRWRHNVELETNADVLARRQKQIDYGKNTVGYDNYIKLIPRNKRSKDHPRTPPKEGKYSRRAFDGLVRIWRTNLHRFDPPESN